jgi:hypothetical protein
MVTLKMSGTEKMVGSATADANGTFDLSPSTKLNTTHSTKIARQPGVSKIQPFLAVGVYALEAVGSDGSSATAALRLVKATPPAAPEPNFTASITLDQLSYTLDSDAAWNIGGAGFKSGEIVMVTLMMGGTEKMVGSATASADGTFDITPSTKLASTHSTKIARQPGVSKIQPFLAAGVYGVVATGSEGSSASATLRLVSAK